MTTRPVCGLGQRKKGSPCIFCRGEFYCAHQYYCPATRQYEHSPGWRQCKKLRPPQEETKEKTVPPEMKPEDKKEEGTNGTGKTYSRKRRKR